LKLISADFVTSAVAPTALDGPQIALAGRSNVGKSSLINALCRRKIARTSAAPGKTRLVNVYRATLGGGAGSPGRWDVYLVDLPGYGYARGGRESADELRAVAEAYLDPGARGRGAGARRSGRPDAGPRSPDTGPDAVILLIDSRHPGQASDIAAAHWLDQLGLDRYIVATKIDKLGRAERTRNLRELERTFGTAALPVSADSGEGLNELWQMIARAARK
jgi:GTP-binding protein